MPVEGLPVFVASSASVLLPLGLSRLHTVNGHLGCPLELSLDEVFGGSVLTVALVRAPSIILTN